MKTRSKALLTVLCAMLLVVVSVCGTLAYLTDRDEAKNTFTVGKVDIELDEAKVGEDGKALTDDAKERVTENTYHLLPGHTYDKDPTITVKAGSDASYVRALVSISNASETDKLIKELVDAGAINDVSGVLNGLKYVVAPTEGNNESPWVLVKNTVTNDVRTYEFRYYTTVAAVKNSDEGTDEDVVLPTLFDEIVIPGAVNNAQMDTLAGLEINVVAHAIQASGFETEELAWEAFDNQMNAQATP